MKYARAIKELPSSGKYWIVFENSSYSVSDGYPNSYQSEEILKTLVFDDEKEMNSYVTTNYQNAKSMKVVAVTAMSIDVKIQTVVSE